MGLSFNFGTSPNKLTIVPIWEFIQLKNLYSEL